MAAGLAALTEIRKPGVYDVLTAKTTQLIEGLAAVAKEVGIPLATTQVGGMFGVFLARKHKSLTTSKPLSVISQPLNAFST